MVTREIIFNEATNIAREWIIKNSDPKDIREFEVTDLWHKLADHFAQENPIKGVILVGGVGTGKSLAMECYRQVMLNIRRSMFRIEPTRHIIREFLKDGVSCIDKYGRNSYYVNQQSGQGTLNREKPKTICFEDLGLEDTNSNMYGNKANIIGEIFLDRYEERQKTGMITLATTNVGMDKIASIYGDRLTDRFKEMMRVIIVEGKSFRK